MLEKPGFLTILQRRYTFCKLVKIYTVLKQKLALFHDNDDDDFIWIEFLVSKS